MNPVTHFLTGWALANCVPSLERKERAMVALACVIPDVDGLGAVADLLTRNSAQPTEWFRVTTINCTAWRSRCWLQRFALFLRAEDG